MTDPDINPITGAEDKTSAALLVLNNAHARETSFLTAARWRDLVTHAFVANFIDGPAAFLIAFDQDADYDSPNFIWFRERLPRFVYVDRIVVAVDHQGGGLARRLYEDLFRRARDRGYDVVGCEINVEPPNPGSDAFHAAMGFTVQGEATVPGGNRKVRYLAKSLT